MLKEPATLLWLSSSVQKLVPNSELSVDTGVLPSLSAALLSPPIRPSRPRSKRSLSEFQNREYGTDDCAKAHVTYFDRILNCLLHWNEFFLGW